MQRSHVPLAVTILCVLLLLAVPRLANAATQGYTFEDGTTDGWALQAAASAIIDDGTTNVQASNTIARTGSYSLKVDSSVVIGGVEPVTDGYTSVTNVQPNGALSGYIYAPSSIDTGPFGANYASFYVIDANNQLHLSPAATVTNPAAWTPLSWDLTGSSFRQPYQAVGITFNWSFQSGAGTSVSTYIDDVTFTLPDPTATPTQTGTATLTSTVTNTPLVSSTPTVTSTPTQSAGIWVKQQSPTGSTLFAAAINPNGGAVAVGSDGTMVQTLDGTNWSLVTSGVPSTLTLRAVAFPSTTNGVAVGDAGEVVTTRDGGKTWVASVVPTAPTGPGQSQVPFLQAIAFVSPTVGYAGGYFEGVGGEPEAILKTTDGGQTWSYLPQPSSGGIAGIAFTSATNGYLLTNQGIILRTTDGGQTWSIVFTFPGNPQFVSLAASGNTVLAGGFGGYFARSTSGGAPGTWTTSGVGYRVTDTFGALTFADSNTVFAGQWGGSVLESTDAGQTWTTVYSGYPSIYGLAARSTTRAYAVGGSGVIAAVGAGPSTATLAIDGTNPSPNVSAPLDTGTVSINLSGVSSPGSLTVSTSITPLSQGTPLGITTLGTTYQVSNAGVSFTSAKSCFPYSPANVVAAGVPEASLRLYHYQGTIWVDVTVGPPDLTNHVICGNTASFSPFEIGGKGTFQVFLPEVVDQSGPSGAAK